MCIIWDEWDEANEIEVDYWEDVFRDETYTTTLASLVPLFYTLAIANVALASAAKNLNSSITK